MNKTYGKFIDAAGAYQITKIPDAGNFEYFYKNKNILMKVDQFGPSFIQITPPVGMTVFKRGEREVFSPWRTLFKYKGHIYNNFDIYNANKFSVTYYPEKCVYELIFGTIKVVTEIMIDSVEQQVMMNVMFTSLTGKEVSLPIIEVATFDPIDPTMAIWDKKEWYQSTEIDDNINEPLFICKHYSVNGNPDDRRAIGFYSQKGATSVELSYEYLVNHTLNFNIMPEELSFKGKGIVRSCAQTSAAKYELLVKENTSLKSMIKVVNKASELNREIFKSALKIENIKANLEEVLENYKKLTNVKTIKTPDENFNKFINNFLPQEIMWVGDLDRGWVTGMRGSRDCANDFLGMINYDPKKVREVIVSLFVAEYYETGWIPRQIPSGKDGKYDLRPFADSGCFVMELIYEYICNTDDWSLLLETFPYYDKVNKGTGLEHITKIASYYCDPENIGEHGLIKLHGGDWLDCLNRVGLEGRGETVMVTCQAILAFKQVSEILAKYSPAYDAIINKFNKQAKEFRKAIIENCYIEGEGFYRALFSDNGKWYFSEKDVDGYKRVYVPTNAYTIISDVNPKNNKNVINAIINNNLSQYGYRLFTVPFGNPPIFGMGKMGTGDFMADALENGAVYNHGANLFFARALAKQGDYKNLFKAINYALPYNQKFHPESSSCLPAYAVTNVYNLTESFTGRGGLSFLTGSISMIHRSVYNWMFGFEPHVSYLRIAPCVPSEYKDSKINYTFLNNRHVEVQYHGYGNKIAKLEIDGKETQLVDGQIIINKKDITKDVKLDIYLK